jgi:hypothetical protein
VSRLIRRHRDKPARLRLTPWGWIFTVAVPVLVIIALVDPARGVIVALIVLIFVWALIMAINFPSSRTMNSGDRGRRDYGREAAEEWERGHGPRG